VIEQYHRVIENSLFPARGLPLGSAVRFLLLALRPGMAFCHSLPTTCSSLYLLPLCPQGRYVWLRLGWKRFWIGTLEGALYTTTVIIIIKIIQAKLAEKVSTVMREITWGVNLGQTEKRLTIHMILLKFDL